MAARHPSPPPPDRPARQPSGPAWLTVARLVKTQGRRGELAAQVLTDFPQRLLARQQVWLWNRKDEPRPMGVERIWPHKEFLVFQFAGCDSITAAKELLGLEVQIPRAEAAPLGPATFYQHELTGCRVVEQASGAELGRVGELQASSGATVLVVKTAAGKELLIPFAEEICRRIAPDEQLIEVVLPPGLRELND